jgi:hypothetical protein
MIVRYQFRRGGYYASGQCECDDLKQAEEMLWKIPLKHFDWKYMDKLISETSNSLFIEEIKNSEHKTIGSLEQEKST